MVKLLRAFRPKVVLGSSAPQVNPLQKQRSRKCECAGTSAQIAVRITGRG
jgi:hypothetical protein